MQAVTKPGLVSGCIKGALRLGGTFMFVLGLPGLSDDWDKWVEEAKAVSPYSPVVLAGGLLLIALTFLPWDRWVAGWFGRSPNGDLEKAKSDLATASQRIEELEDKVSDYDEQVEALEAARSKIADLEHARDQLIADVEFAQDKMDKDAKARQRVINETREQLDKSVRLAEDFQRSYANAEAKITGLEQEIRSLTRSGDGSDRRANRDQLTPIERARKVHETASTAGGVPLHTRDSFRTIVFSALLDLAEASYCREVSEDLPVTCDQYHPEKPEWWCGVCQAKAALDREILETINRSSSARRRSRRQPRRTSEMTDETPPREYHLTEEQYQRLRQLAWDAQEAATKAWHALYALQPAETRQPRAERDRHAARVRGGQVPAIWRWPGWEVPETTTTEDE